MAQISLGESRWRMLRRVLRSKRFVYEDCRNQTRHDDIHFEWMVEHGFFVKIDDQHFEVTEKGRQAADLGFYEV